MTTVGKRHRPLRDEVVDELRKAILDGTYAAGARLTELAVAEELGVSRLPVREAFRKLEAEGLLEAVPRRGVRVTSATAEELEAVHEIRMAMELLAVRRTVRRRDPDVLRRLSDALEEGERAVRDGHEEDLDRLNDDFHELLSVGSGSRVLGEVLRSVRVQIRHLTGGKHSAADLSWAEHASIMRAVIANDSELAELLMRRHLTARQETAADS